jgi:hypothetical protein
MARRREIDLISMSMLDAITCGFGAVILFFMIITANVDLRADVVLEDRSAEARRLELQVAVGRENLAELREALATIVMSLAETQVARDQLAAEIERTEEDIRRLLEDESASEETIEQLEAELERLELEKESLAAQNDTVEATGNFIREVRGEGYRQYLTGLSMGGQRILILVDASSSMLDTSFARVAERRARGPAAVRASPKWRQVVDSVDWITAQIPQGTQFQVVAYNREAWSVIDGTDGQWLTATDGSELDRAVEALRAFVPGSCRPGDTTGGPCGATSLHAAIAAMSSLVPSPDNVYLLTDGLPTMGEIYPDRAGVTGRERMQHFARATRGLPNTIPINVLLYALEGDPRAAAAYWALTLDTGGSLMAPSEDWP